MNYRQLLNEKVLEDPDFRQRLIENPRAALAEILEISIPDNLEIEVLEDSRDIVHIVLPKANT